MVTSKYIELCNFFSLPLSLFFASSYFRREIGRHTTKTERKINVGFKDGLDFHFKREVQVLDSRRRCTNMETGKDEKAQAEDVGIHYCAELRKCVCVCVCGSKEKDTDSFFTLAYRVDTTFLNQRFTTEPLNLLSKVYISLGGW